MPTGECTICKVMMEFYRYPERGNQPIGRMSWRTDGTRSLQGYECCGTLIVSCNFDRGVQGNVEIPNNKTGKNLFIHVSDNFVHVSSNFQHFSLNSLLNDDKAD